MAAFPTVIANCLAGTSFNEPRKSPIAVLQALTITTSFTPICLLPAPQIDSSSPHRLLFELSVSSQLKASQAHDALRHLNFVSHIFHCAGEVLLAKIWIVVLDADNLFLKIDINGLDARHRFQFLLNCIRTGFAFHILDFEFYIFHDLLPPIMVSLARKNTYIIGAGNACQATRFYPYFFCSDPRDFIA
jgi:hypothetical protein